MARQLKVAAAQLGPIHKADRREAVVVRLMALLREAPLTLPYPWADANQVTVDGQAVVRVR